MNKTIACLLVASALSMPPISMRAQDFENSAPFTQGFVQDEVISPSAPSIDVFVEDETLSESTSFFDEPVEVILASAPLIEEPEQNEAVLEGAPSIDEPAQAVAVLERDETAQAASATTDLASVTQMISKLEDMNGKDVIDQNGEFMGTITGVDEETNLAEVGLVNGGTIALMPDMLTDIGNGVVAADLTGGEAVAAVELSDSDPGLTTVVAP